MTEAPACVELSSLKVEVPLDSAAAEAAFVMLSSMRVNGVNFPQENVPPFGKDTFGRSFSFISTFVDGAAIARLFPFRFLIS